MNKVYGFEGETKQKYSELTFKLFEDVFCSLPIATLVSASQPPRELEKRDTRLPLKPILSPAGLKRYYIVHGGLYSKDGVSLEDIKKIERMRIRQPGTMGLMSESLWADPQDLPGRGPSKRVSGRDRQSSQGLSIVPKAAHLTMCLSLSFLGCRPWIWP